MATGGSGTYNVVCHFCNQSVVIYGGDFQNSMELHNMKEHPNTERFKKNHPNSNGFNKNPQPTKKKSTSSISNESVICPICKERVEIINNNYNKSLQKHFENHNQPNIKPRSDDQLYTFDGIRNWIDRSENSDNRSTSSRDNSRKQQFPNSPLNRLPMGLKKHIGFLRENKDGIYCNICRLKVDSNSVEEHIKTKTHEDNVVLCLKQKFPNHLQSAMEFVSFYGSNLCCNLCRCKIDLSSFNIHETLINILFHNSDACHTNKKPNSQNGAQVQQVESPYYMVKLLAVKHPEIDENKNLIKSTIEPQFKCIWCDKSIPFHEKENELAGNFIAHFNSAGHKKSKVAFNILKGFKALNLTGYENHKLVIANGSITCIQCKCKIESDINKILLHSSEAKPNEGNNSMASNKNNKKTKPVKPQQKFPKNVEYKKVDTTHANPTMVPNIGGAGPLRVNLQAILGPLEQEFGKINCIIQKEQGSVLCLICNSPIPSTSQNIRDHLTGNNHLRNVESQLAQINNADKVVKEVNAGSTVNALFHSLPFGLQEDKKYIKDSPIDGYLICSLCNQVINPEFLREHLLDKTHIVEKQAQSGLLVI